MLSGAFVLYVLLGIEVGKEIDPSDVCVCVVFFFSVGVVVNIDGCNPQNAGGKDGIGMGAANPNR